MNKLVINTANDNLIVVLQTKAKVFYKINQAKAHHNETMLPLIDELLREAKTTINDIDEFGVVIGPGSFTGIRVGISTIKAFRDATKTKAKGINNLDFLYALAKSQNKEIETVAILGSRNSYFVAKKIGDVLYKYDHNLTHEELLRVADGKTIGMFLQDETLNCFVVDLDVNVLLKCFDESEDETLVPVYYQLSQAESEKLKSGKVEIMLATKQDVELIAEIEKESIINNTISKEEFENALKNENYKILVCKFNDEVVGFIYLQYTDEICIMSVAVKKDMRNLGIATKLINQTFEMAKENNMNVSLEVNEKNLTASLLYQKLGFSARRIRKNYYADGSNAIEMFKELKKED